MRDAAGSQERLATVASGIRLCYQTFGDPESGEPLLLIMGLSGQMIWWEDDFCVMLAEAGFFVIRYDNRDVGRSTKLKGHPVTMRQVAKAYLGMRVEAPYSIADLAHDAFGLLDHLQIESAHVCGISMGGMIAQTMATEHPERVRTLTSIMSSTGRRSVGWTSPRILPRLVAKRPKAIEEMIDFNLESWRFIASPGYPFDEDGMRRLARATLDRGRAGNGVARQMLALLTQPDRTEALHALTMPTLVIHGLSDRMVHVSGGRATAAAIPGSELLLVKGMGHDLPPDLWELYVIHLLELVRRTAPGYVASAAQSPIRSESINAASSGRVGSTEST